MAVDTHNIQTSSSQGSGSNSEEIKLPPLPRSRQTTPTSTTVAEIFDEGILLGGVEVTPQQVVTQWDTIDKSASSDVLQLKPKVSTKKKKKSPFKLPTEEESANQKEENKEAKERSKVIKIYEKPTASYLHGSTRLKFSDLDSEKVAPPPPESPETNKLNLSSKKDKENLSEFIQKKREIFFLEYSLNVKREEIKKLNEIAQKKEEVLKQAEKTLEEDATKFDAFLKENNLKTMEATRRADAETKVKLEKQQEVKRLTTEIASVKNELAKIDEQLDECRKYKEFLDQLAPQEWKEKKKNGVDEMYFNDPKQLLDIFKGLEENNMFLIQNCQESDSVLDELRVKRSQTETAMEADIANLKAQIDSLNNSIAKENQRCTVLEERASKNGANEDQEIKLEELNGKVNEVYQKCIGSNEANIGTLQMLTKIEKKMEELFAEISKLPSDYVFQAEKTKEKDRRQRQRADKIEIQRLEQEKRIRRALERAQAPTKKVLGKPVMFRSVLPQQPKKKQDKEQEMKNQQEKEEMELFFS